VSGHPKRFVGIDVSADACYVVVLDARGRVIDGSIVANGGDIITAVGDATGVAIDAPDHPSTSRHAADASLARKFRSARCAEVALFRTAGFAVPWTTPPIGVEAAAWMRHGFSLWARMHDAGHGPLEAYPYAIFRQLGGAMLPPKSRRDGREARVRLLRAAGVIDPSLALWGHDGLDAAAAALLALLAHEERAHAVMCLHEAGGWDGSAIWLPDPGARVPLTR
jgi:predicted nuclease with RNAse H fold